MNRTIAVDFETFYDKTAGYDIRNLGMVTYVRHERFDPYLISVSDGSESWAGHPRDFNWNSLQGQTLLSHNSSFDSRVLQEMTKRGLAPKVDFKEWHCTANLTTYLCMRRDLLRAAEFLLGVAVDKSYRMDADGKHWDDMVKAGVLEKVKEAGRVDALRCHNFWTKFGHLWPERERRLSGLTIKQCHRGCTIDVPLLMKQLTTAQKTLIQAESVLPWMAYGKKPTSTKAIAEECRKVGIPSPPVKSRDGEEAYDEWALAYAKYPWVKAYTDYRVVNKYISKLETIKERLMEDGRCPYELLYFGAHTGRWQSGGGLAMQTLRKDPLFIDCDGWLVTDPDKLKDISKCKGALPEWVACALDERALWIAAPGKNMMAPDLSQIEPRVLAWLVQDKKMLDLMAAGRSPYQAHAETTMDWTRGDMKTLIETGDMEAKELYALAKARVLGLGFGCGWKKFITVAQVMANLDITKDDPKEIAAVDEESGLPCLDAAGQPIMLDGYGYNSKRIVRQYREQNPLITGLWKKLDEAFKGSIGGNFEMELPSGRSMRYPKVMREHKRVMDPDNPGKWLTKWVITALAFDQKRNAVVRKPFYGGLLCENLVQATARDVFGECLLRFESTSGINNLFSVHDEGVIESEPSITVKDVKHLMSQTPEWIPGLPVACDVKIIPHYTK